MNLHGTGNLLTKMVICVKILLLTIFLQCFAVSLNADVIKAVDVGGSDLAFRNILINKSLNDTNFSCIVTQKDFAGALKELAAKKCDIVIVRDDGSRIKNIPDSFAAVKFAETGLFVCVNEANPLRKLKISDLAAIWNDEITHWKKFIPSNIFTIHRFGMPLNDGEFVYIKRHLNLKDNAHHFPLDDVKGVINMVAANPNGIGIGTWDKNVDLKRVHLLQLTDDKGKNIKFVMPHYYIVRKNELQKFKNFMKDGK